MGFMDAAQAGSRIAGKVSGNTGMKPMGMQGGQGIGPSNPMGGMNPMNPGHQMRTQRPSSQPQSQMGQMGQMPGNRMGQMGGMMGGMFGGMMGQKPPQSGQMSFPQLPPKPMPQDGGMTDVGGWGKGGGMRDFQMGNQQPTFADPGMFRRMNPNIGGSMGPYGNGLQDFLARMGGMGGRRPQIQY